MGVVFIIFDWIVNPALYETAIFVYINTTTMIPCRHVSQTIMAISRGQLYFYTSMDTLLTSITGLLTPPGLKKSIRFESEVPGP